MDTLQTVLNTTDPQAAEPYTPLTLADAVAVAYTADSGCWQTWTGTHYSTLDGVPWQASGSAVLVECDGHPPAHS